MQELEAIAGLATLENRNAAQIELLVRVARDWPKAQAQTWLLELARSAYGLRAAPLKPEADDPVEVQLIELLHVLCVGSGPVTMLGQAQMIGADTWIAMMNSALTALEQQRRQASNTSDLVGTNLTAQTNSHRLESVVLEVLEFVKQHFFGRVLNIAERSALRGLYERQRNLRAENFQR
jgi:hypothetical protein